MKSQSGLTIVELLVSVAIAAILASVLLAINLQFFGNVMQSQISAELAVESHFVLEAMVEDIRLADGITVTNSLADANGPAGGWSTSDSANRLVLKSPAINSSRDIIYDDSTGFPYRNELVYFMSGKMLYRRTLKNGGASGNIAVTTCPASTASSSCPVDKQYTTYINDMTFTFYDTANAVTTDPTLARSIKVGINMSRKAFGKTITFNNSIQTTLRNY
ncbi:MAG TPA: type II secretion system protein [Patescibacteria group bacterium]|nr:type II secretion system protein [Patescibacteria group bacterium]